MDISTTPPSMAVEALVSYSHRDEKYRQQLETHLSLLRRQKHHLSVWHDRRIGAGTEWKGQIDAHLESDELILLLVSPDFLASDYCYDVEVTRALGRHEADTARVIPIILRPVDWHGAPFGKLQALPEDGKSISTWPSAIRRTGTSSRGSVKRFESSSPASQHLPKFPPLNGRSCHTADTGETWLRVLPWFTRSCMQYSVW
jgi:hypothetical protein